MRFGGVAHFYVYDQCHQDKECQRQLADPLVYPDVTYHRWPARNVFDFDHPPHHWEQEDYMDAQQSSYTHATSKYAACAEWQIIVDIDEYPFSSTDTSPGFLVRTIRRFAKSQGFTSFGSTTQLAVQNKLFLGKPSRPDEASRIGRNIRSNKDTFGTGFRTSNAAKTSRIKPMFLVSDLDKIEYGNPHVFKMSLGKTKLLPHGTRRLHFLLCSTFFSLSKPTLWLAYTKQ